MAHLRDFFGSKCPRCALDILQQLPSANRMQPVDLAWCPSCQSKFTVEDLQQARGGLGWLKRLLGSRPQRG